MIEYKKKKYSFSLEEFIDAVTATAVVQKNIVEQSDIMVRTGPVTVSPIDKIKRAKSIISRKSLDMLISFSDMSYNLDLRDSMAQIIEGKNGVKFGFDVLDCVEKELGWEEKNGATHTELRLCFAQNKKSSPEAIQRLAQILEETGHTKLARYFEEDFMDALKLQQQKTTAPAETQTFKL
ncbi:MAG: hypothetical protein PHE27_01820 [Alphaproteobacteria bacterium]|nr:hypothetical protein [Alphaproteobacteria bacterium]